MGMADPAAPILTFPQRGEGIFGSPPAGEGGWGVRQWPLSFGRLLLSLAANVDAVQEFKNGLPRLVGGFVGHQAMFGARDYVKGRVGDAIAQAAATLDRDTAVLIAVDNYHWHL